MELKLLSLEERHERADMIQTFKIIHGFCEINPATWFRKINHNRVTRIANDPLNLEIQNSRTSFRNNFFGLRVPRKCKDRLQGRALRLGQARGSTAAARKG